MTSLLLIGGGGHCRSCIDVVESAGGYEIVGVLCERVSLQTDPVLGYPIVQSDEELGELLTKWTTALITVGHLTSPETRIRIYEFVRLAGATLPVIVSSNAYISKHAQIGEGTIVMHGSTINAGVDIGVNCIINSLSLVEHDVVVGSHSHISTGARVNGGVTIGEGSFVGSGAIVYQGVTIGANCVIAAGAIIRKDLPPGTLARGDADNKSA